MSPEQALGKLVDRRTDLFALGIVLYQLTTGRHPMRGDTDVITLHNIVSNIPIVLPSKLNPAIPASVERVIIKALQREPSERFQTAREFELELEQAAHAELARVRTEEVGEFVTQLLGQHGEERRAAVRESIRLADERGLAARFRAREEEATWVGAPSLAGEFDPETNKSSAITDLGRSPQTWANDLTQVDTSSRRRAVAPTTLWLGISAGVILGAVTFWFFSSGASMHHVPVTVQPHPSSVTTTAIERSTATAATEQTWVDAAAAANPQPPSVATSAPMVSVRRKPPPIGARQGFGFSPPPVSNPGF
jgi:serine/threonine-protein kinase